MSIERSPQGKHHRAVDTPTLFLSAGEVSGDQYGGQLAQALRARRPDARLIGWGGDHMARAGVEIMADLTACSAVGVSEQLPAVVPVARALRRARAFLAEQRPDLIILIDYQGANMALARAARQLGIPTAYFIAPQEWIWGFRGGLAKVAGQVDLVLSIFHREAEAYRQAGATVAYVGHPLLDRLPPETERSRLGAKLGLDPTAPTIALFPGSRRQEVRKLLRIQLAAAERIAAEMPDACFVLPIAAPHLEPEIARGLAAFPRLRVVVVRDEAGIALLRLADVALAASGTVTLEAAIVGTPVVALYRVSPLTSFIARRLLRTRYVTLPNIVADAPVIPELLQGEARPDRVASKALELLNDPRERARMMGAMSGVRAALGEPGATSRAAQEALALAGLLPTPDGSRMADLARK